MASPPPVTPSTPVSNDTSGPTSIGNMPSAPLPPTGHTTANTTPSAPLIVWEKMTAAQARKVGLKKDPIYEFIIDELYPQFVKDLDAGLKAPETVEKYVTRVLFPLADAKFSLTAGRYNTGMFQDTLYRTLKNRRGAHKDKAPDEVKVLKKPRATNATAQFLKENSDFLTATTKEELKAQNKPAKEFLKVLHVNARKAFAEVSPEVREEMERKAKGRNDEIAAGPAAEQMARRSLTGKGWEGHGDVVFHVCGAFKHELAKYTQPFRISVGPKKTISSFVSSHDEEFSEEFRRWADAELNGERYCTPGRAPPSLQMNADGGTTLPEVHADTPGTDTIRRLIRDLVTANLPASSTAPITFAVGERDVDLEVVDDSDLHFIYNGLVREAGKSKFWEQMSQMIDLRSPATRDPSTSATAAGDKPTVADKRPATGTSSMNLIAAAPTTAIEKPTATPLGSSSSGAQPTNPISAAALTSVGKATTGNLSANTNAAATVDKPATGTVGSSSTDPPFPDIFDDELASDFPDIDDVGLLDNDVPGSQLARTASSSKSAHTFDFSPVGVKGTVVPSTPSGDVVPPSPLSSIADDDIRDHEVPVKKRGRPRKAANGSNTGISRKRKQPDVGAKVDDTPIAKKPKVAPPAPPARTTRSKAPPPAPKPARSPGTGKPGRVGPGLALAIEDQSRQDCIAVKIISGAQDSSRQEGFALSRLFRVVKIISLRIISRSELFRGQDYFTQSRLFRPRDHFALDYFALKIISRSRLFWGWEGFRARNYLEGAGLLWRKAWD
ncbi:hypothetical protein B0H16DRAFT_1486898 [Mycena metata]|uniref:Uncharacterized protein n=1 Tax=Mycena metata TaxID=1033252 RepID=A0AAD7DG40_9AGAR|nr:hypothetical protein B0H16DRAFT_1486898 [Mycena metata]